MGRPIIEELASDDCPPAVEFVAVDVVDAVEVLVVPPAAALAASFSLSAAALAIRSSNS